MSSPRLAAMSLALATLALALTSSACQEICVDYAADWTIRLLNHDSADESLHLALTRGDSYCGQEWEEERSSGFHYQVNLSNGSLEQLESAVGSTDVLQEFTMPGRSVIQDLSPYTCVGCDIRVALDESDVSLRVRLPDGSGQITSTDAENTLLDVERGQELLYSYEFAIAGMQQR